MLYLILRQAKKGGEMKKSQQVKCQHCRHAMFDPNLNGGKGGFCCMNEEAIDMFAAKRGQVFSCRFFEEGSPLDIGIEKTILNEGY